jgi:hypothetical protein
MLPLHIGADHLGYLPLLLAAGVIVFIAATALRTKLERMNDRERKSEQEREAQRRE